MCSFLQRKYYSAFFFMKKMVENAVLCGQQCGGRLKICEEEKSYVGINVKTALKIVKAAL